MVVIFFVLAVLSSGFGVADTHVLFSITPSHAPSRHLVVAGVATSTLAGLAPVVAGFLLEQALLEVSARVAYRALFLTSAVVAVSSLVPLRHFGTGARASSAPGPR